MTKPVYEIRAAVTEEIPQYTEMMKYAFTVVDPEIDDEFILPEWSLCAFDGKQMAASSAVFPFLLQHIPKL